MNQAANELLPQQPAHVTPNRSESVSTIPSRLVQATLIGVYTGAIFTGAALIFLVQPMVAKMALPLFGGSPAVWNTSMVFFQALLLAGYAYAHVSTRWLGLPRQSKLHLGVLLLPLLMMPIHLRPDSAQPDGVSPTLRLLLILALTAGLPFFVVSTASPILQRWFSGVNHPSASDPYFLYAASNAGSLIALLAYPVVVEPNLTLAQQGHLWTGLYVAFLGLCVMSVVLLNRFPGASGLTPHSATSDARPLRWRTRLHWVFLAFVPSSLMVGATGYLSTDVASAPFLWVVPLAIYLLTFILAFASRQIITIPRASLLLAVSVVACAIQASQAVELPVVGIVAIHLVLLFAVGMLAHTRLALQRPATINLTEFYLLISVGGVLGGAFNALIAPVVFDAILEYPIVIALALLLRPGPHRAHDGSRLPWALDFVLPLVALSAIAVTAVLIGSVAPILMAGALVSLVFLKRPVRFAMMAAVLLLLAPLSEYSALHSERTFFGVLRVTGSTDDRRVFEHGTTVHGIQDFSSPERRSEPLSYYTRSGPIGQVFTSFRNQDGFDQIAVVGLGAGSLAAYGQPGQMFTFIEIDPSVVSIASDPRYFTYLSETDASLRMIVGDGRLRLQEEPDGMFDLMVMDAFSSDSVPVHLLTVEAIQLYFEKLQPKGMLAVHISNRNLEMEPIVAAIADELHLVGLSQRDIVVSKEEKDAGKSGSHWVILARSEEAFGELAKDDRWRSLSFTDGSKAWTDDFSNIITTVKWFK